MSMHVIASNPLVQSAQAEMLGTPTKEIKGRPNPAFQPETTVNLEGSVKTALQVLNKAINNQATTAKALPQEIQKLISNIMKNSFSLDQSVAEGLTSALQGQRASTEQLNVLGKILSRLGTSLQNNSGLMMTENLQTLLNSLKFTDGQTGKILDTTLLHKAFMQLMDGRPLEEMPKELQFLLRGKNSSSGSQTALNGSTVALQQLIKQLMPSLPIPQRPAVAGESMQPSGQQGSQTVNQPTTSTAAQTTPNSSTVVSNAATNPSNTTAGTANAAINLNQAAQMEILKTSVKNEATNVQQQPAVTSQPTDNTTAGKSGNVLPNQGGQSASTTAAAQQALSTKEQPTASPNKESANMRASSRTDVNDIMQTLKNAINNSNDSSGNMKKVSNLFSALNYNLQMANAKNRDPNAAFLRAMLTTKPLENTPELMDNFKRLAQQLLRENNGQMTEQTRQNLQNLSSSTQTVLPDQDVKSLQELIRVIQQNLPYAVKNVAIKHNMPDAVKVWTMAQLSELIELQALNDRDVLKAGKSVTDFMTLLKTSVTADAQTQGLEKSMVMMMPVYLGENETIYPSYIHIFHQQHENAKGSIDKKETWFRVCMLTENVGAVELVFRMYGRRMDMKLAFSDEETAIYFPYYMQDIREAFRDLNIQLADVKINVIGDVDEL